MEAMQMMRRGVPPSGLNPFPMAVPLDASTAASGLAAAQQVLPSSSCSAVDDQHVAGALAP
jgi:hypothetical protein